MTDDDPITMVSLALTAAGTAVTAAGTIAAGNAAQESANFKAQQLDQAAAEARAAGQRNAMERREKAKLVLSSLQAKFAAQGGGDTTSPGALRLAGNIADRGEYQALSEMYLGENRARGLTDEAAGARYSGEAAKIGSRYAAVGTVLSGLGSMAKTYGGRGGGGQLPDERSLYG